MGQLRRLAALTTYYIMQLIMKSIKFIIPFIFISKQKKKNFFFGVSRKLILPHMIREVAQ